MCPPLPCASYTAQRTSSAQRASRASQGSKDGAEGSTPVDDFGIDPSDTMAGRDVIPQLERLRVKAVGRVRGFLLHKIADLRKPRTNVQMVQEHVLLRLKFVRRLAARVVGGLCTVPLWERAGGPRVG